MQGLLERTSPKHASGSAAGNGSGIKKTSQLIVILGCVLLAAFVALVILPSLSQQSIGEGGSSTRPESLPLATSPRTTRRQQITVVSEHPDTELVPNNIHGKEQQRVEAEQKQHQQAKQGNSAVQMLKPWGYNLDRNVARWTVISSSINGDQHDQSKRFTLIDYGSDQGYFGISAAHAFPHAYVVNVELGGTGGIIWQEKTKKKTNVLEIQQMMMVKHSIGNAMICQTRVKVEHFDQLVSSNLRSRYQFVLSVFHWFPLATRRDFERVICQLLRNAQTTFIELPTVGDHSKIIQQQVGYKYFKKWYAGRTDIGQILEEAGKAENLSIRVTLLKKIPWLSWTRDVYRVDLTEENVASTLKFGCEERRKIYGCNTSRTFRNSCPNDEEGLD